MSGYISRASTAFLTKSVWVGCFPSWAYLSRTCRTGSTLAFSLPFPWSALVWLPAASLPVVVVVVVVRSLFPSFFFFFFCFLFFCCFSAAWMFSLLVDAADPSASNGGTPSVPAVCSTSICRKGDEGRFSTT